MEEVLSAVKKIHLVGIGGIGMSGLALLLKDKGYKVSGSDLQANANTDRLRDLGIDILIGRHKSENIGDADLICVSSAISEDNPELLEARKRGIPVVKRAQLLAVISKDSYSITVAGAHGKTTTASLLGFMLNSFGFNPTVFVGGIPLNYNIHAWWGSEYFVIEVDESDGTFLLYDPRVSIITNIDCEHMDYFCSMDNLKEQFRKFMKKTKDIVIGCGDDPSVRELMGEVSCLMYGFNHDNDIYADNIYFDNNSMCFDVVYKGRRYKNFYSPLLGRHNILNILAVLSYLCFIGEDLAHAKNILREFKGTKRRMQVRDRIGDVTFVDDYAHHPREIVNTLDALRFMPHQRLVVVFQPHRFSRVKHLYKQFSHCFSSCDYLIVTNIYSASEAPIPGIDDEFLYKSIRSVLKKDVDFVDKKDLPLYLAKSIKNGDLVVGLGAGDIDKLMGEAIEEYKRRRVQE